VSVKGNFSVIKGRTLKIFLADGDISGVMTAEIMNWTGKIIVAPKTALTELAKRPELKKTGVYMLVGDDPDRFSRSKIYIGESDSVFDRLIQHNGDERKGFWNRTIVIFSKDENLSKSHGLYLEQRLIEKATDTRRATLENVNLPGARQLPESEKADMEYFLEQVFLMLPVLGFSFMMPLTEQVKAINDVTTPHQINNAVFVMKNNQSGYDAKMQEVMGEFVILKGSKLRETELPSLSSTYREMRRQLLQDEFIERDFVTLRDIPTTSVSAAAQIVSGMAVNGQKSWRNLVTGETYALWDQQRIDLARQENPSTQIRAVTQSGEFPEINSV